MAPLMLALLGCGTGQEVDITVLTLDSSFQLRTVDTNGKTNPLEMVGKYKNVTFCMAGASVEGEQLLNKSGEAFSTQWIPVGVIYGSSCIPVSPNGMQLYVNKDGVVSREVKQFKKPIGY